MSGKGRPQADRKKLCEAARYYVAHKTEEGVSQRKVAKEFGVSQAAFNELTQIAARNVDALAKYERGEISLYSARLLGKDSTWEPEEIRRVKRLQKIREMADAGHHSEEIAQAVNLGGSHLRELMRKNKIRIPETQKFPRVQVEKALDETVNGLAGYVIGLEAIDVGQVTQETAQEIVESLGSSLRELGRLYKQLKEIASGHG